MTRHTDAWKANEKRVARALHGQRVSRPYQPGFDVIGGGDAEIVADAKDRQKLPAWLTHPLTKVRAEAGPTRLGVVVRHAHGARDSIVCLSLKDWQDWYGELPTTFSGGEHEPGAG